MTAAMGLAHIYHDGQVDKAGDPYYEHLRRVVEILVRRWPDSTEDEINAAWLHDVLEDTDAPREELQECGISLRTIEIIEAISRPSAARYLDWIRDIAESGDLSAIKVKLADNEDNSDPARVAALGQKGRDLLAQRYAPAKFILEAGYESAKAAQGGS